MTKSKLKKNYLVVKSNSLNEMRANNMTLQELRLLCIYMSKINPRDKSTRTVRFPLEEFHSIMDVKMSGLRANYYTDIAENLLHKIIKIPLKYGFKAFSMFRHVIFEREDKDSPYYFEIEAHEDALPLLFDLRDNFFKYELWNALRLKGKNQLRMYEVLKQYEYVGYRIITIKDLKEFLGIEENEYPRFKNFNQAVLETCQKALAENTDISFTYEPYSKKGRKIHELKFTIKKNKEYKDPLTLEKFIDLKSTEKEEPDNVIDTVYSHENDAVDENGFVRATGTTQAYEERIELLMEACNNEFNREEIIVLYNDIREFVPHVCNDELKCYEYLFKKYHLMEMKSKKVKITSRFNYLRKIVGIVEA